VAWAAVLERDGLPKIDPLRGGRFWPAVRQWFLDRHGLAAELPSRGIVAGQEPGSDRSVRA